jgi:HPt (histidine-containing phosphotransfer) domain-containing protein
VSGKISHHDELPATRADAEEVDDLLDHRVLDELRQVMGDDYKNVIHSYLQHSSQLFTKMRHMAGEGNIEEVTRSAHSFKSSSKNVGAIKLGDMAMQLEQKLRRQEPVDLNHAVQELLVTYDQVARLLEKIL